MPNYETMLRLVVIVGSVAIGVMSAFLIWTAYEFRDEDRRMLSAMKRRLQARILSTTMRWGRKISGDVK